MMYFVQTADGFKRCASSDNAHDIDINPWVYDINEEDDTEFCKEDFKLLKEYKSDTIYYTKLQDVKYILVVREWAHTMFYMNIGLYPCYSELECIEQAEGHYGLCDISFDDNNECDVSDDGSEDYSITVYLLLIL